MTSSQGFRVALVKPFLSVSLSDGDESLAFGTAKETYGFSLGYANLPIGQLGFTTNLTYITFEKVPLAIGRFDGNIGTAFNSIVSLKGGLNISQMIGEFSDSLRAGIGVQGGAGFQINPNLGIDIALVVMRVNEIDSPVSLSYSGAELALHGTF